MFCLVGFACMEGLLFRPAPLASRREKPTALPLILRIAAGVKLTVHHLWLYFLDDLFLSVLMPPPIGHYVFTFRVCFFCFG